MSESFAWMYFTKSVNEEVAVCNKCKTSIKCRGRSTSGLIRHLKSKHDIEKSLVVPWAKRTAVDDGASTSSSNKNTVQQKLTFFIRNDTRD